MKKKRSGWRMCISNNVKLDFYACFFAHWSPFFFISRYCEHIILFFWAALALHPCLMMLINFIQRSLKTRNFKLFLSRMKVEACRVVVTWRFGFGPFACVQFLAPELYFRSHCLEKKTYLHLAYNEGGHCQDFLWIHMGHWTFWTYLRFWYEEIN